MQIRELVELRGKRKAKSAEVAKVFEEAKPDSADGTLHFEKISCLGAGLNTVQKVEKLKQMNDEINDLQTQIEVFLPAEKAEKDNERRIELEARSGTNGIIHPEAGKGGAPDGTGKQKGEQKSFGKLVCETEAVKNHNNRTIKSQIDYEMKTLFQTSAGWAPESLRTGRVIDKADQPIRLIDVMPTNSTTFQAVKYMDETTLTLNAAEKAEAAVYAESAFKLTERTVTIEKITTSVPVSDEQLEDVPRAESYLEGRLRLDLLKRLDNQIVQGDGVTPNILGILNKAGIQTQARGADPIPDAFYKAIILVQTTGEAEPNVILVHPLDWQDIRLLRTADGVYIFGMPGVDITPRMWGLPVVTSQRLTQNTGIVGDFGNFSELVTRRNVEISVGTINDDFSRGKKTIRGDFRVATIWYRAAAFATVTGI